MLRANRRGDHDPQVGLVTWVDRQTLRVVHQWARPEPPDDAEVPHLTAPQWRAALKLCGQMRSSPWLELHTRRFDLPRDVRAELAAQSLAVVARTLDVDRCLLQVTPKLLDGPSAPALLLKGRAIELRAYPAHVLRPAVDVDILVRPGAQEEVENHLSALGYKQAWQSRSRHNAMWMEQGGGNTVEVHKQILCPLRYRPFAQTQLTQDLFDRAVMLDRWLCLQVADQTAHLLVHLNEGAYADWRHLADLGQWLRNVTVDAQEVAVRLKAWRASRAGTAALIALQSYDRAVLVAQWQGLIASNSRDLQAVLATATRELAVGHLRWRGYPPPRWLEAAGLCTHLDQPLPWLKSWLGQNA